MTGRSIGVRSNVPLLLDRDDGPLCNYSSDVELGHVATSVVPVAMSMPRMRITRVFLAFCTSSESRTGGFQGWVKKWITHFGGRINHVEPVFVFENQTAVAVSITLKTMRVQFETRNILEAYKTAYWECFPIELTDTQKYTMYDFCAAQNGKPFNKRGLYCNFFPLLYFCFGTRESDDSKWFCSQLIMAALKLAKPEDFGQYIACQTSPQALRDLMTQKHCFSIAVSYMGRINEVELRL